MFAPHSTLDHIKEEDETPPTPTRAGPCPATGHRFEGEQRQRAVSSEDTEGGAARRHARVRRRHLLLGRLRILERQVQRTQNGDRQHVDCGDSRLCVCRDSEDDSSQEFARIVLICWVPSSLGVALCCHFSLGTVGPKGDPDSTNGWRQPTRGFSP
ncbi:hypothetical protein H920_19128 [Fukomys damarensis]|uniref:Uncharacterized protein n=1 Tax=Fukomys damarensis TaxID=885580 RepID=A0A091CQC3_FUKDA|nr:hypothetical protein H920_19128 [Fukomys damarensis]